MPLEHIISNGIDSYRKMESFGSKEKELRQQIRFKCTKILSLEKNTLNLTRLKLRKQKNLERWYQSYILF